MYLKRVYGTSCVIRTFMIMSMPITCSSVTSEMLKAPKMTRKFSGSSRRGFEGDPMMLSRDKNVTRKDVIMIKTKQVT